MGHMNIFKFNSLIPELSVTDILKTKHVYVNVLGFEICYERKEDNFIDDRFEELRDKKLLRQYVENKADGEGRYTIS